MLLTRSSTWILLAVSMCPYEAPAQDTEHEEVEAKFGTTVVIPSGLRGDIYYISPNSASLPKFEKLEPVGTIYTNGLNIPPREFTEGFPGVTKRVEFFAIDYTGRFISTSRASTASHWRPTMDRSFTSTARR